MLACPRHHHPHHHSPPLPSHPFLHLRPRRHNPNSATTLHLSTTTTSALHHHNNQTPPKPTTTTLNPSEQDLLRKHNAKSTTHLLRHFSPNHQPQNPSQPQYDDLTQEDKLRLLEMSLIRKRTPQFPGSIYVQSPSDIDVTTSLPPLHTLFKNNDNNDISGGVKNDCYNDDEMIMRALKIRRAVTAEILKEAMRRIGKFGITYATNVVSRVPDFIDFVMIEAAAMKGLPEFGDSTFNVRAKAVIEDSGVVQLVRWLKHNSLSYPQIGKLICMSKGNLESIRRVVQWLKTVHVKGRFLGVALMKAGESILERSTEELDEIVDYLESNGVRMDWMGYVMSRCPQLLSYSLEEVKTRVAFYVDMGMNEKDFGTMVFDYPKVLGYLTMEEMNQKVSYLKEFGLNTEDIGRLLAFKPQLMACSIEERWKPLVKYFYYLGIDRDGMRRILTIKPMVFCIDLETTIAPKVQFFRDIGIREDAIGGMLAKFPPLLTYSLHKKIRRVVIFLMTNAGVTQRDIGKVIALGPELLGCSIVHKLDVNVKYFLSLGIPLRILGEMIADFPMLLRYNIDLLHPKYRYLRRAMVRPLKDLIEFPSYSLDDRIIPRHKVMVEKRVNFKLRYMLASTDEEFDQRVEAAVERRRRFEAGFRNDALSDTQANNGSLEPGATTEKFDQRVEAAEERHLRLESATVDDTSSDTQTTDNSLEKTLVDFSRSEIAVSGYQTTESLIDKNQLYSSGREDSQSFSQ